MKLISKSPSSKNGKKLFLLLLIFAIVLSTVWLLKSGNSTNVSGDLTESIHIAASSLLKEDPTISEFTIDTIKLSHKNKESEEVYIITFSIKPTDPTNFILTGGGVKGESGWINEKVNYVTVKDNETLVFSTTPMEGH